MNMPIITLEVLSDCSNTDAIPDDIIADEINDLEQIQIALSEKVDEDVSGKSKNDLLEYMMKSDGSVVCKLCGEILQSRTHWYRHKYKLHVIPPFSVAPLYQCERCLIYFKSRKGYIGHLSSRHSELLSDSTPVLTNAQAEIAAQENSATQPKSDIKLELDPENSIPKTSVPNYQASVLKPNPAIVQEPRRFHRRLDKEPIINKEEWEERRSREEKLVSDIIDRVRRECEAQGGDGPARRGYSRRTTVMHTT